MEKKLHKIIMSMVLTFSLIFSTLAIPAMAADHSIELRATSGNSYFGCLVKLKTMAQLGKVKGVKVNGTDYAKVTKKTDLTQKSKYWISETDPEIGLSAVKNGDKIDILTDTEKLSLTVKNADAMFGDMHDANSVTYSPLDENNSGGSVTPPSPGGSNNNTDADIVIKSSEKRDIYTQLVLKFTEDDMAAKVKAVKVNGKDYTKKDTELTVSDGNSTFFYIDNANKTLKLTKIENNDKVELITDKGTTSFTAQNMTYFATGDNFKDVKFTPKKEDNTTPPTPGDNNNNPKPGDNNNNPQPPTPGNPSDGKFTPEGNPPLQDFKIKVEPAQLANEVSGVRVGPRDYVAGSKISTWNAGTFYTENGAIFMAQPDDQETVVLTFKDGSKRAFTFDKAAKKLTPLNEVPKVKELKVRLKGSFEAAVVGQKGYDGISGASTSTTINKNSNVILEAVEVEPGTKDADIPESAWKPLKDLTSVKFDGDKSRVVISADSGMTAQYSYLTSQVTLNGTPKAEGTYPVTAHVVDKAGRTADSNGLNFKVYDTKNVKLIDQLKTENANRMQDGKYLWDMEPWAIDKFGGDNETVTVPKDIKGWYGSHTSGTYGELGHPVSGEPTQTLIIDKDTDLTLVNMKMLSSVKIVVKNGGKLRVLDSVIYGKVVVEDGGTFSMNYDNFAKKFVTGGSIAGQIEVHKGGTLENAYIYSHANYLANGTEARHTAEPVVRILGDATIKGEVHVKGEDSAPGPIPGQTGLSVENGATVTVTEGSVLGGYGGGESSLTRDGGPGILLKDGAKIVGDGKVVAVGGSAFNVGSGATGKGGSGVEGNGTIDTKLAYIQGGNTNTKAEDIGKPYEDGVNITNRVVGVANDGRLIKNSSDNDQPSYWRNILNPPTADMTPTGDKLISPNGKPLPEEKPEVKPETKPEVKPETKPEVKPETKPEVKPEMKNDGKKPVDPKSNKMMKKGPKTGDETNPYMYLALLMLFGGAILAERKIKR